MRLRRDLREPEYDALERSEHQGAPRRDRRISAASFRVEAVSRSTEARSGSDPFSAAEKGSDPFSWEWPRIRAYRKSSTCSNSCSPSIVISADELPLAVCTWIRASPSHRSTRFDVRWMSWIRV